MSEWRAVVTNQPPGFTLADMQNNVGIITTFFRDLGWTDNAIAGMLGNMQVESYLNPGQYQIGYPMSPSSSGGFGLVQWTPVSKYANWAGAYYESDFNKQLYRIRAEYNGLYDQWIAAWGLSFYDYSRSYDSPSHLARVFFDSYERGTWSSTRETYAESWYTWINGTPFPPIPPDPPTPSQPMPKWLLIKLIRGGNNNGRAHLL